MLAAAMIALVACETTADASLISGVPTGTSGQAGTDMHAPTLVGRWSRTVIFTEASEIRSSQTIWEFRGDGTATRTVIASNVTEGIADQVVVNAVWRTTGETVIITYTAPDSGTVQFMFGVMGSALTLGGLSFTRIG